ncbi:MAG: ABC transporter ATP-binding protein, partial [Clostridia bacterium]|nr:ABC transporter ATP-binding protein [Clostridia bacterium]
MRLLLSFLKPLRAKMALGLSIKIAGTVAELFLPVILTHILDRVIITQSTGRVLFFGALMIFCAAFACAANIIANRMAAKTSMHFSREMRSALFKKTLSLCAADVDRFTVPSLESRITTDTYNVHNFVSMVQRMGVRAPILFLGGMTVSFILDARLALVMLCILPLIFVFVTMLSRKTMPLYATVQSSVDSMVRVVREDAQGIRVIKALSKNDYENRRFAKENEHLSASERHAGTVAAAVNPTMTLIMNLGITAAVLLSAYLVRDGISTSATVIAVVQYFTLISMAMMALSRMFVMYTKCAASARRIAEVLETPDRLPQSEKTEPKDTAHISFNNVSFSYFGKKNNLEGVSFSLLRGESLGIIGATGSGKSTLISLLLRFYDPNEGEIRIGGLPLSVYPKEELTAMFGAALQNDFLFADTIKENIRFGRPLSEEAVQKAAEIAQAHDFICEKEGGYDFVLSAKGTNLSGGQRQRLLIARAIAAVPDILILDDASSALDYKTDAALRQALKANLPNTTTVVVAQRVSSVKDCS